MLTRNGGLVTVAVHSLGHVHHFRSEFAEVGSDLVGETNLVHLVEILVVASGQNGSHPHSKISREPSNEEGSTTTYLGMKRMAFLVSVSMAP